MNQISSDCGILGPSHLLSPPLLFTLMNSAGIRHVQVDMVPETVAGKCVTPYFDSFNRQKAAN